MVFLAGAFFLNVGGFVLGVFFTGILLSGAVEAAQSDERGGAVFMLVLALPFIYLTLDGLPAALALLESFESSLDALLAAK